MDLTALRWPPQKSELEDIPLEITGLNNKDKKDFIEKEP